VAAQLGVDQATAESAIQQALPALLDGLAAESGWVVGFEVILGAYSPLSMAAMAPVSLSGNSSAMDVSDR
jgi:hypothetical protein